MLKPQRIFFPPKRSKFNIDLVQGIPTESSIKRIKVVKGFVRRNFRYGFDYFKSKAFECPICEISISVQVGYEKRLHIRSSKCPECNAYFCLVFENYPDWCKVCRTRNLQCLRRHILLVEVLNE